MLRNKGHEEFLPLYRARRQWKYRVAEVELPLFSGYVFFRFSEETKAPVVTSQAVFGIVCFGGRPVPIDASEIAVLQKAVASNLNLEPWPYFDAGERVAIVDGPLRGVEGMVLQTKKSARVLLSVTLLRRSVVVEVDQGWIMPLDSRALRSPSMSIEDATAHRVS